MEVADDLEWFSPRPNRCLHAPSDNVSTNQNVVGSRKPRVSTSVCDRTLPAGRQQINASHQEMPLPVGEWHKEDQNDSFIPDSPLAEPVTSTSSTSSDPNFQQDPNPLTRGSRNHSGSSAMAQSSFHDHLDEEDPFGDEDYYNTEFKTVAIPSGSRDRFPIGHKLSDSLPDCTSRADHKVQVNGEIVKKGAKSASQDKYLSTARAAAGFTMQPQDIASEDAGYLHRSNTNLSKSTTTSQMAAPSRCRDTKMKGDRDFSKSLTNLNISVSFNVQDASQELIQQRLILLLDNRKFEECAILVQKIASQFLSAVILDIPLTSLISAVPHSLSTLCAIYTRVAENDNLSLQTLLPKAVISRLVEWLASDEDCNIIQGELGSQSRFLPHLKQLLQILTCKHPKLLMEVVQRETRLAQCLRDLGSHGLLDGGEAPVSLHEALKSELIQAIHSLKAASQRLDDGSSSRSLRKRRNSEVICHQRLIQMSHSDVERRLIHNKSLLDLIKPAINNTSLMNLLRELEARIEADKRVIVLLSDLNKELANNVLPSAMLAPIFQRLHSACKYLHSLAKEVCQGEPWINAGDLGSNTNFSGCDAPVPPPSAPPGDQDSAKLTRSFDEKTGSSNAITADVTSANGSACSIPSTCDEHKQEVELLRSEVRQLRKELSKCHEKIQTLQDREAILKDRLSEQALRCIEVSSKFEDLSLGNNRPTQLVRRYGNLYTETRLDAFDALEDLPEIADFDDLKGKLLFSVVVLAFRSVQRTLADIHTQIRQLLCLPSPDARVREPTARQVEETIGIYLRKTVSKYDTSKNVAEVCEQVWSTLYDYPSLRRCEGLKRYITECVQLAWALSVQNPPLVIDYTCDTFNEDIHTRFHTSDPESQHVRSVLWPVLREGDNGPCVYKGVVIT